jgi:thiol:disulfide interchange protein
MTSLRRRAHEIDYLRLIQLYQKKHHEDDNIVSNQHQLLISTSEIQKYVNENELVIEMLLTQHQQAEYRKIRKEIEINENKSIKRSTKRKASAAMTELHNTTAE